MSTIVAEPYDVLCEAGVSDDKARAAAGAVLTASDQFATRIELANFATKADLANLKAELIMWNVGTIIAMTAVFAAIVKFV
jgi:hypothetical protein